MDDFEFDLPADAPPDMTAIALLGEGLHGLRVAVEELHSQHQALTERVDQAGPTNKRKAPACIPWPLRWAELDPDAADTAWAWLIEWVVWFVGRYQLVDELPHCWPRHGPLIEELTALAAGWYAANDDNADAVGPLVWHERLARCRTRIREWDEHTRCRNGTHTDRHLDLDWPTTWYPTAYQVAMADIGRRRSTNPTTGTNKAGTANKTGTPNKSGAAKKTGTANEVGTANKSGAANKGSSAGKAGVAYQAGAANRTDAANADAVTNEGELS